MVACSADKPLQPAGNVCLLVRLVAHCKISQLAMHAAVQCRLSQAGSQLAARLHVHVPANTRDIRV
jgi:hypothetical protein